MTTLAPLSDAERMDRHYRFQRYIYDATRTHYLLGRKHLIRSLAPPDGGTALEIGCGTAWNLVRAAHRYPTAAFHGLDVSKAMLDTAAGSVARHGLEARIVLKQGDATSFEARVLFGQRAFDRVFFSYALSMIPGWRAALDHATQSLASGGELHIVDFGQCEHLPGGFKRMLFAFLAHYSVTPRADLEPTLATLASRNGLSLRFERLHRGYTHYAVLTRA
ncbi:MAG: class I SAM-dependent methyltransferase [Hyphomicrobium sp.]